MTDEIIVPGPDDPAPPRPNVPNPEGVQPGANVKRRVDENEARLRALDSNAEFLAAQSPNNGQILQHIRLITRQVPALIRLLADRPDEP